MAKIIKQELPFEENLKQRFEFICEFSKVISTFVNGSIRKLKENNQLTQKLDIAKYYGELKSGNYRIAKPGYDNGYIDIYANEFEIK